jgi:hypothetical protein
VVDAAPVEEVAEVEAKDEVCCASKSNPTFQIKQIKTRTGAGEVSDAGDAGDWEVMEVAIWELELAEGKAGRARSATGTTASERFLKKRLKP